MHWGHATSQDLIHWTDLPIALAPVGEHQAYSGSAIIDHHDTLGLGKPALVLFYTRTGVGQCIATSTDGGITFDDRHDAPVLARPDRDPKVFWHAPTHQWVMVLYRGRGFDFFTSDNLTHWTHRQHLETFYECPDLFPLTSPSSQTRWALIDGDGSYHLGDFDGQRYTPTTTKLRNEYDPNAYATQTWNHLPDAPQRTVQIAWMRDGQWPGLPFSQQMTLPVELSLREVAGELRMTRRFAAQLEAHLKPSHALPEQPPALTSAAQRFALERTSRLRFDLVMSEHTEVELTIAGHTLCIAHADRTLSAVVPCPPPSDRNTQGAGPYLQRIPYHTQTPGVLRFDALLDTASLELLLDDGSASYSASHIPTSNPTLFTARCTAGTAVIQRLRASTPPTRLT